MIYGSQKRLEDRIVELLAAGRKSVSSLYQTLAVSDNLSLRAVYKSVHSLMGAGVVLKVGKQVMLDQEWAKHVVEMLNSGFAPALSAEERAVYTFTSIEHLDAFWKTVMIPLEHSLSAVEIFFYNPHNFWAYLPARKQSEDAYYQHFLKEKRYGFFTIGGNSEADIEFKREYQNEHLQIDLREIKYFRRTDHITIIDSMIITVRLAKGVAERIDKVYASGKSMENMLPEIVRVCQKPGKIRFVIENNPKKSEKIRRVLAKNFYIRAGKIETP
ncbi:MAG: hypothetical protein G01um101449_214 [Parcubacteria group bacterium Gr01-1014_49]|nr:MAG: hypothetical protein G01um101449_214 [Parcubacteria group bacterium Gr01-1014_49]